MFKTDLSGLQEKAKPVPYAINGQPSLSDIQEKFGEEALELIGHLYHQGMYPDRG